MALSVYLIYYDARQWIQRAAQSVLASDIPVTLTIVSNSGWIDVAGARTIDTGANIGFAGAGNIAIREWICSNDDYVLIGSHDLIVEPDTLRLLVEAADRAPAFGILGPVLRTNWVGERLRTEEGIERVTGVSGTCLLLRRECIIEVGPFDEIYGSYAEDVDLCVRAISRNWDVGRVQNASASGIGSVDRSVKQVNSLANMLLVAWRKGGLWGVVRRYVSTLRRFLLALLHGGDPSARAIGRALVIGTGRLLVGVLKGPPRL